MSGSDLFLSAESCQSESEDLVENPFSIDVVYVFPHIQSEFCASKSVEKRGGAGAYSIRFSGHSARFVVSSSAAAWVVGRAGRTEPRRFLDKIGP